MAFFWIIFIFHIIWISTSKTNAIQNVYYHSMSSEEFISVVKKCDEAMIIRWKIDFHDCFMTRKYDDGGRDLDKIVDRIMDHAEACVETSEKDCKPDYADFKNILGKVLEQMKDYSDLYLQEIHSGRDKIKDLKCVEDTLTMDVYEDCFGRVREAINETDHVFEKSVRNGIQCTNERNIECSREARTSLNRIVRNIFQMEQPPEEDEMGEKAEPPPPKMWYEYITEPFVTVWNAISSFFSSIFG